MEKARYFIHGTTVDQVLNKTIAAARQAGILPGVLNEAGDPIDRTSILGSLHPAALYALKQRAVEAGTDLKTLAKDLGNAPENPEAIKTFLEPAVAENPYRLLAPDGDGGFAPASDRPASAALAFSDWPGDPPESLEQIADVRIGFFDEAPCQVHRAPGRHGGPTFLRRGRVEESLGIKWGNKNQPVHVFVVDQGMSEDFVNENGGIGTYSGLLWNTSGPQPHPAPGLLPTDHESRYRSLPQWHAHMIVRNILSIAGGNHRVAANKRIHIYDVPVVPDRVTDVTNPTTPYGTAELISFQYLEIENYIKNVIKSSHGCVIVNAWGVQDRFREVPLGAFTEKAQHPLNEIINRLAKELRVDVVFAAGNNGLFTANPQAGALDRGPGRSIFMPAALPDVWAIGASDANGTWIGLSSQGPGMRSTTAKPDFNIASHFCEEMDAHVTNTGSSASCALMAGVLADHWRNNRGTGGRPDVDGAKGPGKAKKRGHMKHSDRLGAGLPQHKRLR